MDELTPIYRVEHFLDTIVNGSANPYDPIYRIEKYLAKIAGEDVEVPTPIYRVEMYLAQLCGMDVTIPDPIYRIEFYLAKKCGMDVETPVPIYRIEYWLDEWADGGSGSLVTITGVSPLTLANALAHSIHSLTQYGKCEQPYAPTPSASADILCNNGALRYGALGNNLIDPSAANTILGYYINKPDGTIKPAVSNFMFAGYMPVEAGKTYVAYGRRKSDNDLSDYNRIAWYDSNKNWLSGADYTQNRISIVTAPETAAYARFSCNPSGSTTVTVTQELVDSYNWTFAEGNAEIVPFEPYVGGIYTDGTDEVLTVRGKQVWNETWRVGTWGVSINAARKVPANDRIASKDFIDVKPNTTYTMSVDDETYNGGFFVVGASTLDGEDGIVVAQSNSGKSATFTTSATTNFIGFSLRPAYGTSYQSNVILELGSTATAYEPYVTPQTVNDVPMLLSVGDVKDELEFVGGSLTHRIAIKVFDGTETPTAMSTAGAYRYAGASNIENLQNTMVLCTHYKPESPSKTVANMEDLAVKTNATANNNIYFKDTSCQTVADLQAKFAALYAAGTPVILLIVLPNETTEQTTPHALHTSAGTNVVEVTSNVDPVTLECEYMGVSE